MMQMKKIGQLVRDTRKKQSLTQEELSAATAIGVRFIRELEQGKESCHIGKTLTVLAMLGIEVKINGEVL